jgi:hypothetical protein
VGFSLRRWRAGHLLIAWGVYWLLLLVIGMGKELLAMWRVTSEPDAHGNISAGITDGVFQLSITGSDGTVLERSISLMALLVWVAGPPLLLWVAWLLTRPRRGEASTASPAARP